MEQDKKLYTITIAAAVLAVLLSLCVGAFAGGAAGYLAARTARAQMREELRGVLRDWQRRQVQPGQPERLDPELSPGMPASGGAIVTQVVEGGPADQAGIREGDLILAVDDVRITEQRTLRDVVSRRAPGDRVVIVFWRQGRDRRVTLRLGENPDQEGVAYMGVFYEMLPDR
jgi:S1-C subfamily serine protease